MIQLLDNLLQPVQQFLTTAVHRAGAVMAVMLVAVVFMMIVPLPTPLIDALIAINMALSAMLLMVAMYLPNPVAFSSFPAVLLMTTLFRLGLSIATTRLILLQADAGHIIEVFGEFVVGGNLVVGLVVFLILTVVLFIVITKGAERVAEVAARFSLDALPGRQMSIDNDMRAGVIDMQEARRRRSHLAKESQLYGAMDGAMKFVKGDAIASIIIVAINLLGGLAIGTIQRGMPAGEAMHVYSVLSIGDGLVAQIPALFIAITAGIIITRVTSADGQSSNVGSDIARQVFSYPQAIIVAAAILIAFALIPGMPWLVFLILAGVFAAVGFALMRKPQAAHLGSSDTGGNALPSVLGDGEDSPRQPEPDTDTFFPTVPLLLEISPTLSTELDTKELNERLLSLRKGLYFDLGVPFPGIHLRYNDKLRANTYSIHVNEVPVTQGEIFAASLLAKETEETLLALDIPYRLEASFLPNIASIWVQKTLQARMNELGIAFMTPLDILIFHIATVVKRTAAEFIGIQETRFLLGKMEVRFPDLVKELQRVLPPQKISEILQRLVSEGISVRNLRAVCESMIEWGQKEKDAVLLTEHIRTTLRRQITYRFAGEHNFLPAHMLSPDIEDSVRNAIRHTSVGSFLALDPEMSSLIVDRIKLAVGDFARVTPIPVLLTSMDIRRYIRKLIEQEMFDLPVLSFQELAQEINIQPLSRIEMG